MNLHEFQAKAIFTDFGIPVPASEVASTAAEALQAAEKLGGDVWVVKAQVHAGGRGKAGGVKLARSLDEVPTIVEAMLGKTLSTHQTGSAGLPINQVLVEQGLEIRKEFYLSVLVDRASESIMFVASQAGGMDIEIVADETPEQIIQVSADLGAGLQPWHSRRLGFALGLSASLQKQLAGICKGLYQLMLEKDASLVEINPLIVSVDAQGEECLLALDAKLNLDDNALYRQKDLADLRDITQEDAKEVEASAHGLNYISLDGDIGCMVNGAGLAMATMDLIKLHGGSPANFLDVGGGTTAARVAEAFKLILSSGHINAVLVNIFGGIVRCDLIAEGIIQAVKEVGVTVPVIVRLEGTNVERGRQLLAESDVDIIAADGLTDAAQKAVAAAA